MSLFMTRCHVHPRGPDPGCRECATALDVNFQGHRSGTCIPQLCPWHETPEHAAVHAVVRATV